MEIDLRTEHQKQVAQRAERVCALYKSIKKKSMGSVTSIWRHIASQVSEEMDCTLTPEGVRTILIRNKLYEPNK